MAKINVFLSNISDEDVAFRAYIPVDRYRIKYLEKNIKFNIKDFNADPEIERKIIEQTNVPEDSVQFLIVNAR